MIKSCEQVVVNMIQQSISVQYSVHNQSQFWRGFKVYKAQYYSDYELEQGKWDCPNVALTAQKSPILAWLQSL